MARVMLWNLTAAVTILGIAAGSAVPADAAKKRNKSTAGGQASLSDSVDLSYVAGHGSSSAKSKEKSRQKGLRAGGQVPAGRLQAGRDN